LFISDGKEGASFVGEIADVNTATTSDFTGLPSGWSTPGSGGFHL
jgi:hypothetical protein